jgi:hypothetical protein
MKLERFVSRVMASVVLAPFVLTIPRSMAEALLARIRR